jgi:hypothetical protein
MLVVVAMVVVTVTLVVVVTVAVEGQGFSCRTRALQSTATAHFYTSSVPTAYHSVRIPARTAVMLTRRCHIRRTWRGSTDR